MNSSELLAYRLAHQQLVGSVCTEPEQLVARLGALQAQEYAMAKWAVGLRVPGSTEAQVEEAFNAGRILRTHLLRPTWHFVSPADIRWLLALTSPQVRKAIAYTARKNELDEALFRRSQEVLVLTLQGGHHRTREELATAWAQHGIEANGQRLANLLMRAEQDGVLCSGPRQGNQFTYALLEERVPPAPILAPDEALAALSRRYFASRGPATAADLASWSGLPMAQVKLGVQLLGTALEQVEVNGKVYYWVPGAAPAPAAAAPALLLPDYDEYAISYQDRSLLLPDPAAGYKVINPHAENNRVLLVHGQVAGTWRRTLRPAGVTLQLHPWQTQPTADGAALQAAARRYADFLGRPAEVELVPLK